MIFKLAALILAVVGVLFFGISAIPVAIFLYLVVRRRWFGAIILVSVVAVASRFWIN